MWYLVTGLVLFFAPHSIAIVALHWRERVVLRLGKPAWRALYSLPSIAGFVLIVFGYHRARWLSPLLYQPPSWLHQVTFVLMLPVFPLLFAAYLPGRIRSTVRHPMLAAIKLWATAHLLSNGSLADVLVFGSFLLWAAIDRIAVARRAPLANTTLPARPYNDLAAVVLGLALYGLTIFQLHALIIGVPLLNPAR
jgi:uncharacterized membrane protein